MREEEVFAMNAIVKKFGGCFVEGEDPPDAYLLINDKRVAVEVTQLIQFVSNDKNLVVPRRSHDKPAIELSDALDSRLKNIIQKDKFVFLVLESPINNIRLTKQKLEQEILNQLSTGVTKQELVIEQNKISINVYEQATTSKKVACAVFNKHSSADILTNVTDLLRERILAKLKTTKAESYDGEYWLALLNDYWIADIQSYRLAYKKLDIKHNFAKILIVNESGQVDSI